jgi:tetraacyldisaccharide 4'-kinase
MYSALFELDKKFTSSKKLDKPVISVGNITWGGSGKTPIVIELLETLLKNKLTPAVLTRGYARKNTKPVLLKNGGGKFSVLDAGDEPLLIFKNVPNAAVIIGSKRYDNALRFKNEIDPDVYILDDGFQHWKIKRDLDIVCVNAANPFGNGLLIPAGILREPLSALKRAGIIVITNSDMVLPKELDGLKQEIYEISGKTPFSAHYGNYEFVSLDLEAKFDADILKNSQVYSLSGVGFGGGFKNSIEKAGVKTAGSFILKDHKNYSVKEISDIFKIIGGAYIITTAKDAVKLDEQISFAARSSAKFQEFKKRIAVLKVRPIFDEGKEQWETEILSALRSF